MSLATPEKIRTLQRKLYIKAKAEPAFRFYQLYDKVYREDILRHAYRLARANAGIPGVDGVDFAQLGEEGLEAWLERIRLSDRLHIRHTAAHDMAIVRDASSQGFHRRLLTRTSECRALPLRVFARGRREYARRQSDRPPGTSGFACFDELFQNLIG
jgi:hypothetical protein